MEHIFELEGIIVFFLFRNLDFLYPCSCQHFQQFKLTNRHEAGRKFRSFHKTRECHGSGKLFVVPSEGCVMFISKNFSGVCAFTE
jgi:hypothetical protein